MIIYPTYQTLILKAFPESGVSIIENQLRKSETKERKIPTEIIRALPERWRKLKLICTKRCRILFFSFRFFEFPI